MDAYLSSIILSRYETVREKIFNSARAFGRQPNDIRLVVVTKMHRLTTVQAALGAGIRDLGENYAEEAVEKIKLIGAVQDLSWHMIGHIQSRKADLVAQNFAFVHSLDSIKLAIRLDRFAGEAGRKMPVLIECNVGGETTKTGFPVFDDSNWDHLYTEVEKISELPNLEIRGLMTMPPFYLDAEKTRPFFRKLQKLSGHLARRLPNVRWSELSMGTSTDYWVAVEEGATIVRVGTAILGDRSSQD